MSQSFSTESLRKGRTRRRSGTRRDQRISNPKISGVLGIAKLSVNESRMAARGETDLAEMIAAPTLSVDDYISNMGELFNR